MSILGAGEKTLLLAHGFGCDQNMWRFMLPALIPHYKVVLFDYVGSGKSDISYYDQTRYSSLEGYAQDILDICEALHLQGVTFVGHSVSCMTGLIASIQKPTAFSQLIMICPTPCFLNFKPDYIGDYMLQQLPDATLKLIEAEGHCLHMSHSHIINQELRDYIGNLTHC